MIDKGSDVVEARPKNTSNHTWIISDKELLFHHRIIRSVKDYRTFVQRKPKGIRL
ncbi:hypothetical protein [Paenibacillus sp. PK3_47]|uniref:hypothetical protein n=1 Tax=Paenibacillus sp. PK3_47 TaxID=2072642 RepID=UPI00201DF37D|nr:hypothetical protein [Paenibacillus sp. PK3_47]